MRYQALATDYDGTLARNGRVDAPTLKALEKLRASGRKLLLVTGRELDELIGIFPEIELFHSVVAENGGVVYDPATKAEKLLAQPPPKNFVAELKARGVGPISVGRVIVATWEPHETTCLSVIREFGLELEIIFNKGAVMILPSGVNKATGLRTALDQLGLSPHNVVGAGDAENDHAFLAACECGVAVANALQSLKDRADMVTIADHGGGIQELAARLLTDDLASVDARLTRHFVTVGTSRGGKPIRMPPHGSTILVTVPPGDGHGAATGLLERLMEAGRQMVLIAPEGGVALPGAVTIVGTPERAPTADDVLELVAKPRQQAVVDLSGLPAADRPAFFLGLAPRLQELRERTGHPHWIAVDHADEVLPADWAPAMLALPAKLTGMIYITGKPEGLADAVLKRVDQTIELERGDRLFPVENFKDTSDGGRDPSSRTPRGR